MIYALSYFMVMGLDYLWTHQQKIWRCAWAAAAMWSIGFYITSYYVLTPLRTYQGPGGWQYGYKQLVQLVAPRSARYQKVVVDTSYQGPYIYFLFYQKYPPALYQPQAKLVYKDPQGLGEGPGFDNYEFRDIYWPDDRALTGVLFAGPPERLPLQDIDGQKAKLLTTLYFPDGTEAWRIVETAD